MFLCLLRLSPLGAQAPDDPFAQANKAAEKPATKKTEEGDPFADAKQAVPKPAPSRGNRPPTAERIDFQVSVAPQQVRRGETTKLTITGILRPGFHTYPITQRTADQPETQLSQLFFEETAGLKPLWPITEPPPKVETVKGLGVFFQYDGRVVWSQDILVLPEATPGTKELRFRVKLQVCDETCVQGEHPFVVTVDVTDAPPLVLSPELQARVRAEAPQVRIIAPSSSATAKSDTPEERGLLGLLFISMAAAVAMLFTPCVFPMIPITVSFFLKQSEREHHNALLTAGVYSLTIILVLAAAVLVLGQLIVELANNAWLNLALGGLLAYFALSLFGMYEIELPSGLARFTSAYEGKGGYIGAIFMALTFTITSFTCTGPFLGPLLVAVKEYKLSMGERILGSLAYSATFAAPFFVLALFPTLLKALPRSGGWLNAVKVVMGFLELAAALKFVANTDLAWNPGNPMFFNYETVLCAWIALSLACGLYLLGTFRLPHDTPLESLGVARMLLASIFFGLAIYMVPALWRVTPLGVIGKGIVSFLPLDTRIAPIASGGQSAELDWLRDYEEAWRIATSEGKLIFIDFTGTNCTNCRYNEKNVFTLPNVRRELEKYVRVQLYTDSVPDPALSAPESKKQANRNSSWQSETFGDITTPLYAIIKPEKGQPPLVPGPHGRERLNGAAPDRTRGGLISEGKIRDFELFLGEPRRQLARARVLDAEPSPTLAAETP